MSERIRISSLVATVLTLILLLPAPQAAADPPFTNRIAIASHHATLADAIAAAGPGGTLIVDQDYDNLAPIVLPRFFRMFGTGSLGVHLAFQGLFAGSAISIDAMPGDICSVVIEHLDIEGSWNPTLAANSLARGIDLSNTSGATIRNVTVRGFGFGIFGANSNGVAIEDSLVGVNAFDNIHLENVTNSWRIENSMFRFAGRHGIHVEESNNTVIHASTLESNKVAGVFTDTLSTQLLQNRFECWVTPDNPFCPAGGVAVLIGPGAEQTSLIDNFYSGPTMVVDDQSTSRSTYRFDNGFRMDIVPPAGVDPLQIRQAGESATRMRVLANGNVEIGPTQGLSDARLTVNADTNKMGLRVRVGGTTRFTVAANGNVGVGTASPTEKLQVNGNLRLEGDLVTSGEICIGSGCP